MKAQAIERIYRQVSGNKWGAAAGWASLGVLIGAIAWGQGRSPAIAATLPFLLAFAGSRFNAFALAFAYLLATARGVPEYGGNWFGSWWIGLALTITFCVVGACGWMWCFSGAGKTWRKAAFVVFGWSLALLPPIAVIVPGHPVIAWGYLAPGTGWFGVALSVVLPAAAVYVLDKYTRRTAAYVGVCALVFTAAASFTHKERDHLFVGDVVAVTTPWGQTSAQDPFEIITRIERMGRVTKNLTEDKMGKVVIWPESIIQTYEPSLFQVLNLELLDGAKKAEQTVIVGADLPQPGGNYATVAIAFYPDGKSAMAQARQTVPIALWKPWASKGSFLTDWRADNRIMLKDGVAARVTFCYEEFVPALALIGELRGDYSVSVVMSNTWAAKANMAAIQTHHSEGMALLFGRPYLKAENRPKSTS